eukprot:TRINITY_DN1277_c2_g2_i2.p1 TRINITY_DN1277_c2_g2~~TRINITY_DN1277_c2_g2_i2.p1  ORF type:complete len:1126 (+),score=156.56 TRINITY_DN1277_c2_g2_i2:225-3602(+)
MDALTAALAAAAAVAVVCCAVLAQRLRDAHVRMGSLVKETQFVLQTAVAFDTAVLSDYTQSLGEGSCVPRSLRDAFAALSEAITTAHEFMPSHLFVQPDTDTDSEFGSEVRNVLAPPRVSVHSQSASVELSTLKHSAKRTAAAGGEATLGLALMNRHTDWFRIKRAAKQLGEPTFNLSSFLSNVLPSFPELLLHEGGDDSDGFLKAAGSAAVIYCLCRLELDGKRVMCHGECLQHEEEEMLEDPASGFYKDADWGFFGELFRNAGLITESGVDVERACALLTLMVSRGILKEAAFRPRVAAAHAPHFGKPAGALLDDSNEGLSYVMEHFADRLPSYRTLAAEEQRLLLAVQRDMSFNFGWLVQGEAPPSVLFTKCKRMLKTISTADMNFYFAAWFVEFAAAEPSPLPWPGAVRVTKKFPLKLLSIFMESLKFVTERLALRTETQVAEEYLDFRWRQFSPALPAVPPATRIAAQRLALMAQGMEHACIEALLGLPADMRSTFESELQITGCAGQTYTCSEAKHGGPALLLVYAPRVLQKAGKGGARDALSVLVEVLRAVRTLVGFAQDREDETITVRLDLIKDLTPAEIVTQASSSGMVARLINKVTVGVDFGGDMMLGGSGRWVRVALGVQSPHGVSDRRLSTSHSRPAVAEFDTCLSPGSLPPASRRGEETRPTVPRRDYALHDVRCSLSASGYPAGSSGYPSTSSGNPSGSSGNHPSGSSMSGGHHPSGSSGIPSASSGSASLATNVIILPAGLTAQRSSSEGFLAGPMLPRPDQRASRMSMQRSGTSAVDGSGLVLRGVSAVFVQLRNFHGALKQENPDPAGSIMTIHTLYLQTVISETQLHKGTVEQFCGDRVATFYNACRKDALHRRHAPAGALRLSEAFAAVAVQARGEGVRVHAAIGLSTGEAYVGGLGTTGLRQTGVIGPPATTAAAMAVLGKRLLRPPTEITGCAAVICDTNVAKDCAFRIELRPCARVRILKISPQPFTCYQLLRQVESDPSACQEWMYELQAKQDDSHTKEDKAFELYLRGMPEEAAKVLGVLLSGGTGGRGSTDLGATMSTGRLRLSSRSSVSSTTSGTDVLSSGRRQAVPFGWIIQLLQDPKMRSQGAAYFNPVLSELAGEA